MIKKSRSKLLVNYFCFLGLLAGRYCSGGYEDNPSHVLYEHNGTKKRSREQYHKQLKQLVYENEGRSPKKKKYDDWFQAARKCNSARLRALITKGQDVNEQDADGNTALMIIASKMMKLKKKIYYNEPSDSIKKETTVAKCLELFLGLDDQKKHVDLLSINRNGQNVLDVLKMKRRSFEKLGTFDYWYDKVTAKAEKPNEFIWYGIKHKIAHKYCLQRIKKSHKMFKNRPEPLKPYNFR